MSAKPEVTNPGTVVSVRGSVVDVVFDGRLPPIYSVLLAGDEREIVIELLARLDRVPALDARAPYVRRAMVDKRAEHKLYIEVHGEDMPEIRNWKWSNTT